MRYFFSACQIGALHIGVFASGMALADPLPGNAPSAFQVSAVTDADLSSMRGGAFAGTARFGTSADNQSVAYFQQVDGISRVALDNWWEQTGSALIANNLLSH